VRSTGGQITPRLALARRFPRRRLAALLTGLLVLLLAVGVALAKAPKSGHYSGAGSIYDGQAKSTLPVSFTLSGTKIKSLALGPAQLPCTGGGSVTTLTMPALTGFPAERIATASDDEYTYYFEQLNGAWSSIGANGTPATGAPYVQVFAAFYGGKKFESHGGIQIQYNATASGAPDATGPLSCSGSWDGTFAKRT
jgi:hypothetical protein